MAKDIVVIKSMGDALRNTGYKNLESAISEIVDNSVQANAKDVFIIISEAVDPQTGRKGVSEFAFLDNGDGMDLEELGACLGIGYTTRSDRKGMGRFGVGLPQASLHVTPTVDVYSWQNGYSNCHKVYLDIGKVKSGEQTEIPDPVASEIPEQYRQFISYQTLTDKFDFSEHGTLVHWKNCDRVVPKSIGKVIDRLDFALGQKFRYIIKDGSQSIRLFNLTNDELIKSIRPNDPLFLMENNYVLGDPNKPGEIFYNNGSNSEYVSFFEPFTDETCVDNAKIVDVKYIYTDSLTLEKSVKKSTVTLRFSKVKNIFYDKTAISSNPGSTKMGQYIAKMEGISVVRANREIDFGMFDFYKNLNEPQHRWWGCEICFSPELDEAFGVANNKQHVELASLDKRDYEDDEVQPIWLQLYDIIHNTISEMYKINEETRENSRSISDITTPAVTIINQVEEETQDPDEIVEPEVIEPSEEVKEQIINTLIDQGITEPTQEEVNKYLSNKVNIQYKNSGRGPLFDYSFPLGSIIITINQDHPFYKSFLVNVFTHADSKTTFELFIASLVKEIKDTNQYQAEANDRLMQKWDNKLRDYIYGQFGGEI